MTYVELINALGLQTKTGKSITPASALGSIPAAFRCISINAGAIASLPLKTYRNGPKGREEVGSFLDNPHPELSQYDWKELVGVHLDGWGNHYSQIIRNAGGQVVYLDPLPSGSVNPRRVERSNDNPQGKLFDVTLDSGEVRPYSSRDILQIPGLGFNGIQGLSPIGVAREGLAVGLSAEEYAGRLWGSGSLMSGILSSEQELSETEATALQRRWQEKIGGIGKAHEVAVLGSGAKFQQITMPNKDAQFLESRQFETGAIAVLFGLEYASGVARQALYPGKATDYLKWTILPRLKRIEGRLSRLLPKGEFCEFTVAGIERADLSIRLGAYAVGLQNGMYSVNEVRAMENLPGIGPQGDVYARLAPGVGTPNAHPNGGSDE